MTEVRQHGLWQQGAARAERAAPASIPLPKDGDWRSVARAFYQVGQCERCDQVDTLYPALNEGNVCLPCLIALAREAGERIRQWVKDHPDRSSIGG